MMITVELIRAADRNGSQLRMPITAESGLQLSREDGGEWVIGGLDEVQDEKRGEISAADMSTVYYFTFLPWNSHLTLQTYAWV